MKAEKAEIARRIDEVLRIIVDGAEFHDIVQYAAEKQWGVKERQLRNYIAKANDLLAQRRERDRDKLLARHIAQRRNLYARALNAADYRTALTVAKDEAELEGLYPPTKIAPTNPDGTKEYGDLSDADRAAALKSLYARVGAGGGGPTTDGEAVGDGSLLDQSG